MKKLLLSALLLSGAACYAQLPSYVPTTGLLGWYPFNGNANNAAGTGKNGTVNGPVTTTDRFGNAGSAYYFNGHSDNILIDTAFFNTGWNNYSISCWFNSDSTSNPFNYNLNQSLINTIPHQGLEIYYNWGNVDTAYGLLVGTNPAGSSWDIFMLQPTAHKVVSHAWKHIVLVKKGSIDSANTNYDIYLDGVLDTVHSTTISALNYYTRLIIGNTDPSVITEGFWGKLDDYGIWNTALTSCDVKRLFHGNAYIYLSSQPADTSAPDASPATFSVSAADTGLSYQWQVSTGGGFSNVPAAAPYSGVTTPTLTITAVTPAMNGYRYRCIVSGTCADSSGYGKLTVATEGVGNSVRSSVSISPNPTNGIVRISGAGAAEVVVFNSVGQQVVRQLATSPVSLTTFPDGVYYVRVLDQAGATLLFDKVVKQ